MTLETREPRWVASWVATVLVIGQIVRLLVFGGGDVAWLCYVGFLLWAVAAVFGWLPIVHFKKHGGVAPGDSYVKTARMVDTGLNAIVRDPQFVAWPLMAAAVALVSQHPVVIAMGAVAVALAWVDFRVLEARNGAKSGEEYRRYQEQVPGRNAVAGLWRWMRRPQPHSR